MRALSRSSPSLKRIISSSDGEILPLAPPTPVRILCLHDGLTHRNLLELALGPLRVAAARTGSPGNVALTLIFENGHIVSSLRELRQTARINDLTLALVGGKASGPSVFSWAMDDDAQAHGGREMPDLPQALLRARELLRKHSPIDGILGMGQGANIAQVCWPASAPRRTHTLLLH